MGFSDKTVFLDKVAVGIDDIVDDPDIFTIAALVLAGVIVIVASILIVRQIRKNRKDVWKN